MSSQSKRIRITKAFSGLFCLTAAATNHESQATNLLKQLNGAK